MKNLILDVNPRIWIAYKRIQQAALASAQIGRMVLGIALISSGFVSAVDAGQASAASTQSNHAHHAKAGSGLDSRVAALTKALDLDAKQQIELRQVLVNQREQVVKVWNDESVPAAYRIVATQAIGDKTADQIRALLNDEQKKKYNPPRPPHEVTAGSGPSVENWMSKTQGK